MPKKTIQKPNHAFSAAIPLIVSACFFPITAYPHSNIDADSQAVADAVHTLVNNPDSVNFDVVKKFLKLDDSHAKGFRNANGTVDLTALQSGLPLLANASILAVDSHVAASGLWLRVYVLPAESSCMPSRPFKTQFSRYQFERPFSNLDGGDFIERKNYGAKHPHRWWLELTEDANEECVSDLSLLLGAF